MTFTRIILAAVAVIIVGGFAFLALTDVSLLCGMTVGLGAIASALPNRRANGR